MTTGRAVLYLATVGSIAVLLRSILLGPVPLWFAFGVLVAYATLVVAGLKLPQLQVFGDVFWFGSPREGTCSLTFDGGPDAAVLPGILDTLKQSDARATFFIFGCELDAKQDLVASILNDGHDVGVLGYTPRKWMGFRGSDTVMQQFRRALEAFETRGLKRPSLMRVPDGIVTPRIDTVAESLGLTIVAHSINPSLDRRSEVTLAAIRRKLKPGAIVRLKHDQASLALLPLVLREAKELGLKMVSVTAMIGPGLDEGVVDDKSSGKES